MSSTRLLLVDDDPISLQLMQSFLKHTGYQIITATDGLQAERLIYEHAPDYFSAIVLDYRMPHKDGMALLKQLKQDPRRIVPMILQTGEKKPKQIQQGIEAGAYYYLIKPYTPEVFLSIIEAALKDYNNHYQVVSKLDSLTSSMKLLKDAHFQYRTIQEATDLSGFIAHMTDQPKKVGIGLYELLVNAVEHGNLGITYDEKTDLLKRVQLKQEIQRRLELPEYRERYVQVDIRHRRNELIVVIQDMGNGFEFEQYLEFSVERALDNHGRGIMMANKMSFDKLEYSDGGRMVTATHFLTDG